MDEGKEYYALVRKAFRILAPFYDIITKPFSKLRIKVVDFTDARDGSIILDVGTGTGGQAFAFAKKGYEVFGIDLSEDMIKVAHEKNRFDSAGFGVADATKLPLMDDLFDVSCVSFALHDMPLDIGEKVLKEMVRVTKLNGMMVIVDYALPRNRISRFFIYHIVRLYEYKYYSNFIKSDLKASLRKSGVEVKDEVKVLLGAGRILKGVKLSNFC